ncbi:MAG: flavodoxin family protein [Parabacteroides sp.]
MIISICSISLAEEYDVVFIGYPNWWGDMPMAVYTFIDKK